MKLKNIKNHIAEHEILEIDKKIRRARMVGGGGGEIDPIFTASEAFNFIAGDAAKLAGIAAGAEVNVNADWNAIAGDALILNKPSIPTQYTDELAQDAVGGILDNGTVGDVNFTYDDLTPKISGVVKNGAISLAKMADMATASLIYRKSALTGAPEVNSLATLKTDLGLAGTNSGDVTLASPNHGLGLTSQVITLGTPSTCTAATSNVVSTTTHTHAITGFLTSVTAHNLLSATHGDTTAAACARGSVIVGDVNTKWVNLAFPATPTGKVLIATATDVAWSTSALGTAAYAATGDFLAVGGTAAKATILATARAIHGSTAFDGSAAITDIIASTYGGTGNGFTKFTGPLTAEKVFTLPNSSETLLYSGGALGTPSGGTVTNLTGTASININGTVGATTATTVVGTTIQANTGFVPDANDGAYLGTTALSFSDLFLASGAVINYSNGDAVLTHSAGILTLGVGTLKITTPTNTATSVVTIDGTQTLTNKTLTSPNVNEAVALTTTATKLNYLTSATGTTGTTSTKIVFDTSPTLVTPTLGVATGTRLGLGAAADATIPFTVLKASQASTAEILSRWQIDDDATSKLEIINATATDATFTPVIKGTAQTTNIPLIFIGAVTTDSGVNPAIVIDGRTAASGALATRPILDIRNFGTSQFLVSATGHLTMEGVTSTGATGTNNLVFDTSPTIITPIVTTSITGSTSLIVAGAANNSATFRGGNSNAESTVGGAVFLRGGLASATGTGSGGGGATISGAAANGDGTVARAGGGVAISSGAAVGANAGAAMTLDSGNAGADPATGTVIGKNGGAITITTGDGGTAPAADVSSTGGTGGIAGLNGGIGGAAAVAGTGTNTGGAGGLSRLLGGAGGAATGNTSGANLGGVGGAVTLTPGTGGAATTGTGTLTGGDGGQLNLNGGIGGAGTVAGSGGAILFQAAITTTRTMRQYIDPLGGVGFGAAFDTVPVYGNQGVTIRSATGGYLTLARNDISVTANDVVGEVDFWTNDTSTTTNPLAARIRVWAKNTIATDINPGVMDFYTTPTSVAAALALAMTLDESQNTIFQGSALSVSPTGGVGYKTGAGAAVTQTTNRSTAVTCNAICGTITGDATSLAAGAEAIFTVNNTSVALRDVINISVVSGPTANTSIFVVSRTAANAFDIKIHNLSATTADTGAPIINFAVLKAVNA